MFIYRSVNKKLQIQMRNVWFQMKHIFTAEPWRAGGAAGAASCCGFLIGLLWLRCWLIWCFNLFFSNSESGCFSTDGLQVPLLIFSMTKMREAFFVILHASTHVPVCVLSSSFSHKLVDTTKKRTSEESHLVTDSLQIGKMQQIAKPVHLFRCFALSTLHRIHLS